MASKIEYTQGLHKARNKLIELEKRYSAVQWLSHHIQHSIVENIKKHPIVISCLSILILVGLCFVWPYQEVLIYLKNTVFIILGLCFYGYLAAIALGHIFFRLVFVFFAMLGVAWLIAR